MGSTGAPPRQATRLRYLWLSREAGRGERTQPQGTERDGEQPKLHSRVTKKLLLPLFPKIPGGLKPPSAVAETVCEGQGFDGEMAASRHEPRKSGSWDNSTGTAGNGCSPNLTPTNPQRKNQQGAASPPPARRELGMDRGLFTTSSCWLQLQKPPHAPTEASCAAPPFAALASIYQYMFIYISLTQFAAFPIHI